VMFPQPEQIAQCVQSLTAASPGQSVMAVGAGRSSGTINYGSRCLVFPKSL